MYPLYGSNEPTPTVSWDPMYSDLETPEDGVDRTKETEPVRCGYPACSLDALWCQYDPVDRRFPRCICTHHRSYMLIRNPEAVLLYGWIGLFPEGRNRRKSSDL